MFPVVISTLQFFTVVNCGPLYMEKKLFSNFYLQPVVWFLSENAPTEFKLQTVHTSRNANQFIQFCQRITPQHNYKFAHTAAQIVPELHSFTANNTSCQKKKGEQADRHAWL